MLCPQCKCEMQIAASRTVVEGDNSPDTATKVFIEQDLTCANPKCENHKKIVDRKKAYLVGEP